MKFTDFKDEKELNKWIKSQMEPVAGIIFEKVSLIILIDNILKIFQISILVILISSKAPQVHHQNAKQHLNRQKVSKN